MRFLNLAGSARGARLARGLGLAGSILSLAAASMSAGPAGAQPPSQPPLFTLYNPLPDEYDRYGYSVAIQGDRVLVGSPQDSAAQIGQGTVFMFDAKSGQLTKTFNIPLSNEPDQFFGTSVAIDGNRILASAPGDDTGAQESGAAYLLDATSGTLLQRFINPDPDYGDRMGPVALSGDYVLLGVPYDSFETSGTLMSAGSAYAFSASTGNLLWTFNNPAPNDSGNFGAALAISGTTGVIGAWGDSSAALRSGSVYCYDLATGALIRRLNTPNPAFGDWFGYSLAAEGNNLVVGAIGVGNALGAAYLFALDNGALLKTFTSPEVVQEFGWSVGISGSKVVVSEPYGSVGAVAAAGRAYVFDAPTGSLLRRIDNPAPNDNDQLGFSAAIAGDTVLASSWTRHNQIGIAYLFDAGGTTETLTNNPAGWIGGVAPGSNTGTEFSSGASGLCMTVPATGNNTVGWVSPERYIPLADLTAYRVSVSPTTDQITTDAIPLWDMIYDNYNTSQFGNTYGGELIVIDATGGANGIGRPQGRTEFELWAMPLAAQTPQWRGLTLDATSNDNAAFTPHNDASNDMRLVFRELDLDSAGVAADADLGTICISNLRVRGFALGAMSATILWNPPISSADFAPQTMAQAAEASGTATIDDVNHFARYQLTNVPGSGNRKTLIPFSQMVFQESPSLPNLALYPVAWDSEVLYEGTMILEANPAPGCFNGDCGADEKAIAFPRNPVDAIFVNMDTPDNELVNIHNTLVGSPGNMYYASSPRTAAEVNFSPQAYSSFYWGHNASVWPQSGPDGIPGVKHLRIQGDLFNTLDINSTQTGTDPVLVWGMSITRISLP